jgi:hypothetical protein
VLAVGRVTSDVSIQAAASFAAGTGQSSSPNRSPCGGSSRLPATCNDRRSRERQTAVRAQRRFVTVKDGPAFASELTRYLTDSARSPERGRNDGRLRTGQSLLEAQLSLGWLHRRALPASPHCPCPGGRRVRFIVRAPGVSVGKLVGWLYHALERRQLMGDIEGTLGSGLASSGGGVAFAPEEIEAGPGVPTIDQKPTNESADVDNITESGGTREHRVPEKKE